ncbi:MAG: substrate-binding domain-containing protein [Christensenellaceae bacterium]
MKWDCGKLAAEVMGSKGNYVTLGISPENQNWAERSTGAIDYLKENAPEMVHIPGENPYWMAQVTEDQQLAYVQDTITSNPGPICFVTAKKWEGYTNIAVAAISEVSAERQAEIQVIGFDSLRRAITLSQSGAMYGADGQNPYLMGHDSIYHMCDYLNR